MSRQLLHLHGILIWRVGRTAHRKISLGVWLNLHSVTSGAAAAAARRHAQPRIYHGKVPPREQEITHRCSFYHPEHEFTSLVASPPPFPIGSVPLLPPFPSSVCVVCQEQYHSDSTIYRLLSKVKHCRVRLVLRWGATLESLVLFFYQKSTSANWVPHQTVTNIPSNPSINPNTKCLPYLYKLWLDDVKIHGVVLSLNVYLSKLFPLQTIAHIPDPSIKPRPNFFLR